MVRIAVLLTCHNRREKTLTCLAALSDQVLPSGVVLTVILADAGSTDGTSEAVRVRYPQVQLLQGTTDLFWNGGMRLAWAEALNGDFDFYLWLNDDTDLEPDAIGRLLQASDGLASAGCDNTIIVGSTRDPYTGAQTYGGVVRSSRFHPLKYRVVPPAENKLQRCDTMNGNCVLVTREAARRTGNLRREFTHGIGDFDYGLRARASGCTIWVAPGFIGTCARDSGADRWANVGLTLRECWNQMNSPKGLPVWEYCRYVRQHGGLFWPLFWVLPYLRLIIGALLSKTQLRKDTRLQRKVQDHPRCIFVTNFCPHYRVQTFATLAKHLPVEYIFYSAGHERYWQAEHGTQHGHFDHEYLPGFAIGNTRISPSLISRLWKADCDVIIKCINGKFALPVTYIISRLRRKPFVLWTGIWHTLHTPIHRLLLPATRYVYRHADAVVTYGEHVKRYLVEQGVEGEKIFAAHHAVDNPKYARPVSEQEKANLRSSLRISPEDRVVLYVGRLEEGKGLDVLFQAFRRVDAPDTVLVLAGKGEQQSQLENLAADLHISSRVRFAGYVRSDSTVACYSLAHVLVLPSVTAPSGHKECWGLVVNEAMNQAVPVIVTDAVGAAAGGLVRDRVNGFVVPERDSDALADALKSILSNSGLHEKMSQNALKIISNWDNDRMVEGFARAIEYVLPLAPTAAPKHARNAIP